MGKPTTWLRGLFGLKKDKESKDNSSIVSVRSSSERKKEKKRWSFGHSNRDSSVLLSSQNPDSTPLTTSDTNWSNRSYYTVSDCEKEQHKHAIAVAAATASAADAAVAAAQAAVAVVRLTSHGRDSMFSNGREKLAAVKIQTVFRGFLETFDDTRSERTQSIHSRRLSASFDNSIANNLFDEIPKIVEVDTGRQKSRSRRANTRVLESSEISNCSQSLLSPLLCQIPSKLSIPSCRNCQNSMDFGLVGNEECRFSTAQSTPRFVNSSGSNAAPVTPAKSICAESFFRQAFLSN
ncbi:hypothetical protein RJ641_026829 [Dillenia turbinata]|uniref:Uncharacterized protein n=1 Tax=Dillenia turbinata TaxID=194707 RepID=A0AAN8W4J9_9MAGN